MSILKKLKLKHQRDQGIINAPSDKPKKETISDVLHPEQGPTQKLKHENGDKGVMFEADQKLTDGYWIILQDWTQCSLKCGGGTSTLQRMCVPPKNGGEPCAGPNILTRKCHTKPCPNVLNSNYKANNNTVTLKPVVKVMPFSTRPQRYTKCVIKESDLMMTQKMNTEDGNNHNIEATTGAELQKLQIPTRVVMNNRTVTIFAGENYNTLAVVFNLAETFFKRNLKRPSCFFLTEAPNKQVELCPFGCENLSKAIEEWDYDFNLFKYQCNTPRDIIEVDHSSLDKKLAKKIRNAKRELLEEQEKELKRKLEEKENNELDNVVKSTNQISLQAIQKELNLEDMIKKEEAEREAQEEADILQSIEQEKKKSECILKVIRERKLDNQYNLRVKQAEEEVQNIKKSTAQQVVVRRSQLKNAILQMRNKSKKRKQDLQNKLQSVRLAVAQEMGNAYKKGDINNCIKAVSGENNQMLYCKANFMEDYNGLQNCKDGNDFHTVCCDNEFGEFHAGDRQKCYQVIENLIKNKVQNPMDSFGKWVWQDGVLSQTNGLTAIVKK
jgi:hypothetical protein